MPKTKISEFSATPGNNTDIDGINIAEGCAPSGINDAIRELMAQLKDFQAGTAGDSFNGPVGTTTPAAGAFTTLSASGAFALTGDQVQISEGGTGQTTANAAFNALAPSQATHAGKYLKTDGTNTSWDALDISTADITGTLPVANGGTGVTSSTGTGSVVLSASPTFTGTVNAAALTLSGAATLNGGTANGVAYLNGSKVLTTGSALSFDGNFLVAAGASARMQVAPSTTTNLALFQSTNTGGSAYFGLDSSTGGLSGTAYALNIYHNSNYPIIFSLNSAEQARLTSTGLGIGTSSITAKLTVAGTIESNLASTTYNWLAVSNSGQTAYFGADSSTASVWGAGNYALNIRRTNGTNLVLGTASAAQVTLDSSGNLGIGTSSPAYKLDVVGPVQSSAGYYINGNTSGGYVWVRDNYALRFGTNDTERMRLDSSGNLGLGVTPSANAVGNALFLASGREVIWSGPTGYLSANATYSSGADRYILSGFASSYIQTNGQHIWRTAPSGTAGDPISFTQALTLDASGNLGIGTTNPAAYAAKAMVVGSASSQNLLTIQDTGTSYGSNKYYQWFINSAGASAGWITHTEAQGIGIGSDSALLLYSGGATERARITSAGDFIQTANTTAPTLSTNGTVGIQRVSDTELKILMRGSDGVTRSVTLTLA